VDLDSPLSGGSEMIQHPTLVRWREARLDAMPLLEEFHEESTTRGDEEYAARVRTWRQLQTLREELLDDACGAEN
jgi:hypothetical protein